MRWISTRDPADRVAFAVAADRSLAGGGGLYVPEAWPRFDDIDALLRLGFVERSIALFQRLLGSDLGDAVVERIVREAFDFPVPVHAVADGTAMLDLTCGPTLAFKDFGARFLAGVLGALDGAAAGERTILTATSGDTGAAVAHAFWNRSGFRVVVLYPRGRISPWQERQFCTLGGNVRTFAVDGSFDDAQALVKRAFADAAFSERHRLTSANSIHVARLLAQVAYYFEAAAHSEGPLVLSVPSGNFGNLCAGLLARRLGAPIHAFVAATNANATVPVYLETGVYTPRPSVPTLSNAMDVGAPSNWERIAWLFGGEVDELRTVVRGCSVSDAETATALRALRDRGHLVCPHTAVAWAALHHRLEPGERGVFLSTAHASKFPEVVLAATGIAPEIPERLAQFGERPLLSAPLRASYDALVAAMDRDA